MLDYVRIQNYKSIKDATFNLRDVNLLIGANNSGKTNFMKALAFFGDMYNGKLDMANIERHFYGFDGSNEMSFTFVCSFKECNFLLKSSIKYINRNISFIGFVGTKKQEINIQNVDILNFNSLENEFEAFIYNCFGIDLVNPAFRIIKSLDLDNKLITQNLLSDSFFVDFNGLYGGNPNKINAISPYSILNHANNFPFVALKNSKDDVGFYDFFNTDFSSIFSELKIYKPNISTLLEAGQISNDNFVKSDCSNLVSFLDEMNNNYSDNYDKINTELKRCVSEIIKVTTPTVKGIVNDTEIVLGKKLRFLDQNKEQFWVDEVSDGVLYFTAMLCILNQPNPPKLLLLEEPETGIHPLRIREIVDYIFELAEEKGVQVILTSHSSQVVNEFRDLPENIFIFDKKLDITTVKNLQTDVIDPEDKTRKEKGLPPSEHLSNISSHWTVGLLGGVPVYEKN